MKIELIDRGEYVRRTKYWTFITSYYCPMCNSTRTFRTRFLEKDNPRPEDWDDRNEHIEMYDFCDYG